MNIIFVCHGNICRSPIGEILLKELLKRNNINDGFVITSRATSLEEIGNDIYPPMKRVLNLHSIKYDRHYATRISQKEFDNADYIFYMDSNNLYNLERLFGKSNKYHLVSEYSGGFEIEDPWYTGRYEYVYSQISKCVESIYKKVVNE